MDKYIGNLDEELQREGCTYEFDWDDITETIREAGTHFTKWGAEHLADACKTSQSDLKDASEKEYPCDKSWMTDSMLDMNAHCQVAFWKGAKRDREQMMKEAVEGEITKDNRGNNVVRAGVFNKDFEYGDKVRVIVLPKED